MKINDFEFLSGLIPRSLLRKIVVVNINLKNVVENDL